ncbi:SWIM zinc finger family protein [Wolbachia pipientis]|uniref:SWIM zinc finger family protein n=1 Tax=Wolbachia pipientis TaxID=955 RepID=UPI0025A4A2B0|nr:SWIM zinc finger family protein [Wolbachia pipientis]MDM8335232.1 SWIM zinc finger family protein [Wolbachia pipientis]
MQIRSDGAYVYRITLRCNGPLLSGGCSCPAFVYYGPCKHMAATGFALINLDWEEIQVICVF